MKALLQSAIRAISPTHSKLTIVNPSRLPQLWGDVYDLLKPAVDRSDGRWTMEHLFSALYSGQQQLWVGRDEDHKINCVMTTQIVHYPNSKILAFQFLGGEDFNDWSHDRLSTLMGFAKDCGFAGIEAVARFGFWPMLKKRGFTRAYVTYELMF